MQEKRKNLSIGIGNKGQDITEFVLIYAMMIAVIVTAVVIISVYLPSIYKPKNAFTVSGFNGLKIIDEKYTNNTMYIVFQNLLNENIKITGMYLLYNGISSHFYSCSQTYVPMLSNTTCGVVAKLSYPINVQIDIQYQIENTSITTPLNITGWISG
ncbi:MAG: hypothetical protein ACP5MB_10660 [bacterium]